MKHTYLIPRFVDGFGQHHQASESTHDFFATFFSSADTSMKKIAPVKVVVENTPIDIETQLKNQAARWHLSLETGEELTGNVDVESGKIELGCNLPLGYHQLTLSIDGEDETADCRLIVTPEKAFLPQALQDKHKLWGALLQLYTLRSDSNWGIGDLGDLSIFLQKLAAKGGDFVCLNPMHALLPSLPENASPYSPSSRLWLNILYIDIDAVEAFKASNKAQMWFHSDSVQKALQLARDSDYVDYSGVMALKLQGLRLAYEPFSQQKDQEFEQFIADNGEPLQIQATFEALQDHWYELGHTQEGWCSWDSAYHDYHSPAVKDFQNKHNDKVRFYCWLQYLLDKQLSACGAMAKDCGMSIGVYRDLAVGVTSYGAETWADKELYVLEASVGAPPDQMAPQGQDWNLSPMHPEVLQERAYQPFIDLLRANMKGSGALRIDHILAFVRLWWSPKGKSAEQGMYIRYPLDDLLGILALESQRNQCLVIGEALGVVPEGLLAALEEKAILTYNIFHFEIDEKGCKPLNDYPYLAMTAVSTHDLPTIKGYWQHHDLYLGQKLGIYRNEDELNQLKVAREKQKFAITQAMSKTMDKYAQKSLAHQLLLHTANTHSALYAMQPEDWLELLDPVNIPGTIDNYPNWRRKLSKTIETLFDDKAINALLSEIDKQC